MRAGGLTRSSLLLLAALAGCRSPPRITGTYELAGVNGRALPVPAGRALRGTSELVSGSLTLNPDGSYSYRLGFHIQQPGRAYRDSTVRVGTYTLRMSTVTFHAPGGDMSGQLAGTAMVLTMGGWRYLFRKVAPDGDSPADTTCVASPAGVPCNP